MRVVQAGDEPGARAMARDAALARRLRSGEVGAPVVRVHGWSEAVLTLGRGQSAGEDLVGAAAEAGIALVRRPTGGGWLLHLPGDLSVTYVDPGPLGPGAFRATARVVSRAIAAGLREQGRPAEVFTGLSHAASRAEVCFERADRDEVVLGTSKAAGVALARLGRSVLVQTAIPLASAGPGLRAFAVRFDPKREPATRALSGVAAEALGESIAMALAKGAGESVEEFAWPSLWETEASEKEGAVRV